ncbi:MAG: T9SS type A sorting domain-containing protein, partial [Chitinophagales bacterium]|nr:T9SS type A sorting domain-containing protein [Chitinophagales bacterium]
DSVTNLPVAAAKIFMRSAEGDIYNATTDVNGNYTVNCFAKTYDIFCGKWSYKENGINGYVLNPGPATINFKIQKGYYDDFILDLGWTITSNAETGKFVRAEPIGTLNGNNYVNPEFDIAGDWGDYSFMTGNGGGSGFTDDVDDGTTTIKSPKMDLLSYADAVVKFYAWFDNYGGQATPKDSIVVYLSDGVTKKTALYIDMNNFPLSQWNYHEFHVNDYMSPTANMQVTFSVTDLSNSGNVLEAAIDYFKVIDALGTGTNELVLGNENHSSVFPNPFSYNTIVSYRIAETSGNSRIVVKDVLGNEVMMKNIYSSSGSVSIGENLAEGIYFVSIVNGNEVLAMQKIVKVK